MNRKKNCIDTCCIHTQHANIDQSDRALDTWAKLAHHLANQKKHMLAVGYTRIHWGQLGYDYEVSLHNGLEKREELMWALKYLFECHTSYYHRNINQCCML